jgi:hypothetical protein
MYTGHAAAEGEGHAVDALGVDPHRAAHHPVLHGGAHLQAPARAIQHEEQGGGKENGQAHDEQAVARNVDGLGRVPRAHQPLRQGGADLARTEDRAERLLHHQGQAPGGQQGIQRTLVQLADHRQFHQPADGAGDEEGQDDGEEEVIGPEGRGVLFGQRGNHEGGVGADGEELAVGHVDHAHLAEDDRQPQSHQQQDAEHGQAVEALHGRDGTKFR